MIELFTGAVGSGKSYHALRRGIAKVNAFRRNLVVANFPIFPRTKREKENWIYNPEPTVEWLINFSIEKGFRGKEGYCLLIIDEAGIFFNSRDWQIKGQERKEWIKFFSQTRKFGYDVIMVAQDERMIDRQIRSMAEFRVKHVQLRNYVWLKWLPFRTFCYVTYWLGGSFRGTPQIDIFLPWIAKRYDTMRLFDIKLNDA